MARKKKAKPRKSVETIRHDQAGRVNIPTAEYQSVMSDDDKTPIQVDYERRNPDLDLQLVWRGKDQQNGSDPGSAAGASLVVQAPPVYIQEKVHAKVLDKLCGYFQCRLADLAAYVPEGESPDR